MNFLIVEVSPEVNEALSIQAKEYGKTTNEYARELIETSVRRISEKPPSAHAARDEMKDADVAYDIRYSVSTETLPAPLPKTAREILEAAGMVVDLSDTLRSMIIPGVTLEEVQQILADAGGSSLTEILDEHRGPKG